MITLQKANFSLQFDEKKGEIFSLSDNARQYIGERVTLFRFALRDKSGQQDIMDVADMSLQCCNSDESSFQCEYQNGSVFATVSARIADSILWKISVSPKEETAVEWVDFPRIAVPNDLKDQGGTSRILWGFNEGVLVDDLSFKETANAYEEPVYPSIPTSHLYPAIVETQFMAYYNDVSGLYFGAHDRNFHLKGIDFYSYRNGVMLHMRHYGGVNYGEQYQMPYETVMKPFTGEWQDAAQIYREWFEESGSNGFLSIPDNKRLPDWYSESPVVVAYPVRGTYDCDVMEPNSLYPYCNALEHIERLEQELGSKILVLLMHWEGTAPWAPPYVWPPYGGEAELKKFIDALHERGDLIGLYCSGIGWTQYSRLVDDYRREAEFEEKNLKDIMCLSPGQELMESAVVPGIRAGYDMCPSQQFTTDVLRSEVKHMVSAGVDYIQLLDQQHGGSSYFCYSQSHGHPPVPGKWQVDAVRHLLEEIEKETGQVLIGTESAAAESYIPYLLFSDNRFHLNYSVGRPVPVYAYLYHEYVNNFMGNQVWAQAHIDFAKSPENVLERLAYSFSAGDLLTIILTESGDIDWCWDCRHVISGLPDQQNIKNFVRHLNSWRQGFGKKYLHTGKMVKPLAISCDPFVIHCKVNAHETVIDSLHTSAWLSRDGDYGQFLINYHTKDVTCSLQLPKGSYRLYENETTYQVLEEGYHRLTVRRLSACLLEKQHSQKCPAV